MATRKQKLIETAERLGLPVTANMTADDIETLINDSENSTGEMETAVAEAQGSATGDAPTDPPPDTQTPAAAPRATRRRRSRGTAQYTAKMNIKGVSPGGIVTLTEAEAAPLLKMGDSVLVAV